MTHNELDGQISLDDYLTQLDGPLEEGETDMGLDDVWANRMLRELGIVEKRIKANTDMATSERAKITMWETSVNEPLQNRAVWLRARIEDYAAYAREQEDRKTISLPFGRVASTPKQAEWVIGPEFIGWAKQSGIADLIRYPEPQPNRSAVKSALIADSDGNAVTLEGELVPGVTVTPVTGYNVTIRPTS